MFCRCVMRSGTMHSADAIFRFVKSCAQRFFILGDGRLGGSTFQEQCPAIARTVEIIPLSKLGDGHCNIHDNNERFSLLHGFTFQFTFFCNNFYSLFFCTCFNTVPTLIPATDDPIEDTKRRPNLIDCPSYAPGSPETSWPGLDATDNGCFFVVSPTCFGIHFSKPLSVSHTGRRRVKVGRHRENEGEIPMHNFVTD